MKLNEFDIDIMEEIGEEGGPEGARIKDTAAIDRLIDAGFVDRLDTGRLAVTGEGQDEMRGWRDRRATLEMLSSRFEEIHVGRKIGPEQLERVVYMLATDRDAEILFNLLVAKTRLLAEQVS